jgi:hypothetical protein
MRTGTTDPTHGCALFRWRGGISADDAMSLLRSIADRLRQRGYRPNDVGPGKGCLAGFEVIDGDTAVTIVAGEDRGDAWIATWESADDSSSAVGYKPSATLVLVRAAAADTLRVDDRASHIRWMTLRDWSAIDKERRAQK